jgi:hypothetical protein
MVLTSISLHVIAVLVWMIASLHSSHPSYSTSKSDTGPVVILSKEIAPAEPAAPASREAPAAPSERPAVPVAAATKPPLPPPSLQRPPSPESILSPNGVHHLEGGVVFVLDISGSMYEAYAGSNRLTLARRILDREIGSLPNGTPFAVALYGETTRRSGPLVEASDTTRDAAVRYLAEDFNCGGGTNLPAGLDTAAELHPDSLVVVTDGDLNIADKQLMSEARRILGKPGPNLSVIGVAPRAKTEDEQLLRDLVRHQAGTYQAIDAPEADASTASP